jgi:hypothetical protein
MRNLFKIIVKEKYYSSKIIHKKIESVRWDQEDWIKKIGLRRLDQEHWIKNIGSRRLNKEDWIEKTG